MAPDDDERRTYRREGLTAIDERQEVRPVQKVRQVHQQLYGTRPELQQEGDRYIQGEELDRGPFRPGRLSHSARG